MRRRERTQVWRRGEKVPVEENYEDRRESVRKCIESKEGGESKERKREGVGVKERRSTMASARWRNVRGRESKRAEAEEKENAIVVRAGDNRRCRREERTGS